MMPLSVFGGGSGGTSSGPQSQTFTVPGVLSVGSGQERFRIPSAGSLKTIATTLASAPTGASVIVDVNVNGVSIFAAAPANRPTIAVSTTDSGPVTVTTSVAAGDVVTVDVDQIGSTLPGSYLMVIVTYQGS
jgi:hypothetical protein